MNNKKQLLDYAIRNWKHGIEHDKMLSRCYPSIEDDIKSLISEGWIRVIKVNKTSTKNISDSELTKIYFACDKAEKEVEGA